MKTIQRKKRKTRPNRRVPQSPIKHYWRTIKQGILFCSALLFCGFAYAAYSEFHGMFASRPGQAVTWSAGAAVSPMLDSLPWWFWTGMAGLAIYLWVKHKLIMSIIYGALAGLYLAL